MWIICRVLIAISISTALLVCKTALGDYCKWTDEAGVVHYAEECPENTETQQVEIQPSLSQDLVQEAQKRSEAMRSNIETSRQEKITESEKQAAESTQAGLGQDNRQRCVDAKVDLHNLLEGEAMYFDERGELHDQFSLHSSSYTGERTYLSDAEHKALIETKQGIVMTDCVESEDEIITRIETLAARSDSQMCKNLYERVLKDKKYDRSVDIAELQSIERTVLEVCN